MSFTQTLVGLLGIVQPAAAVTPTSSVRPMQQHHEFNQAALSLGNSNVQAMYARELAATHHNKL